MTKTETITTYLKESMDVIAKIAADPEIQAQLQDAAKIIDRSLSTRCKIITCGNGGSMADAMHLAAELTGRYKHDRAPLAAVALSDMAAMSCIANDFGYEHSFSRQIQAIARVGDVVVLFSTSGQSKNIMHALAVADAMRLETITFTGAGAPDHLLGNVIKVPSFNTGVIQQGHTMMMHILCELLGI